MRKLLLLALSLLTAIGLLRAEAPSPFAALDEAVAKGIAKGDCPGAVVLVIHRGEVVHRKAYGQAATQPVARAMTVDAVFDLASLTKPLATALAVHRLIESGKLALDAPVSKYRPTFAKEGKETITIEQLLLHISGLAAGNPVADYAAGLDKALAKIDDLKLTDKPGSRFRYSDINFILLGALVESVSGRKLDRFCREEIFEPMGLKETMYNPDGTLLARCVPTEKIQGAFMAGIVHDPRASSLHGVAGHAGLFSTADDVGRIAQMLLDEGKLDGKQVFPAAMIRRLTTPHPVPMGKRTLGFDVDTSYSANRGEVFEKGVSFGHTGFTGTSIWIDPASKTAVVFLSSRLHPEGKGNVTRLRGEVATLAAKAVAEK